MSYVPVLAYLGGIGVFGFVYWLLDGILDYLIEVGVHETGSVWSFLTYGWTGLLVMYIIFGGIWVMRQYNIDQYYRGY